MEELQSSSSVLILGKENDSSNNFDCASYQNFFEKEAKQNSIGIKSQPIDPYFAQDQISKIQDRINQDQTIRKRRMASQRSIIVETYALYKIIQEVYPTIFQQSIEFLYRLFHSSKIKNTQKKFSQQSIRQCMASFFRNGFLKLYDHSIKLLRNRIIQITKQFQSRTNKDKWNIKVEILAHYIKTIIEFQEFIPNKQNFDLLKPDKLISILNIEKNTYKALKQQYFEAKRDQVQFYDEEKLNISVLINTYYILQVRKKCQRYSNKFKEIASYLSNNRQTVLKEQVKRLKAYKQKYFSSKNVEKLDGRFKTFSEEYIRIINKKKKSYKPHSLQEIEQEAAALEQLFKEDAKDLRKHEKIQYLLKKYKRLYHYYKVKFENYKIRMKQYKNNLDSLKQIYITKQIRQNVNVTYEELCRNYFTATQIFISRRYFEDNINNFFRKQVQYQQILYLNNLMNLIQTSHNKREIFFMQVFQFTQQKACERERHILAMAINVQGINYCKEFTQIVDFTFQFKKFTDQIVDNLSRSSFIINTDPNFRLENYFDAKRCIKQKEIHILPCPALSCFPNPCQKIYRAARKILKRQRNNYGNALLIEKTQFYAEKIAQLSGIELVEEELKKSKLYLDFQRKNHNEMMDFDQSSYFLKKKSQIEASLMVLNTSELRECLETWKLYNQKINNTRMKGIKFEDMIV